MKNLCFVLTSLLFCGLTLESAAQSTEPKKPVEDAKYCRFICVEANATNKIAGKGVQPLSADPCGNYYVNVFFHFIRDNNGNTGQPVSRVQQYMNILNNAYNGQSVFFAYI